MQINIDNGLSIRVLCVQRKHQKMQRRACIASCCSVVSQRQTLRELARHHEHCCQPLRIFTDLPFFKRPKKTIDKQKNQQQKRTNNNNKTTEDKKKKKKTLNNTVNVRGRRWATVKPQSCISSPKANSAPLEDVTGGFRGRYAQPLP